MAAELLTYAAQAERLKISPEAARARSPARLAAAADL
jgi:hypothetical protein